jgi:O-antigen ligase
MDRMALAFLGILLLSFIPQFYWPEPDWRSAAVEIFGINLPASLSIQPWVSFEAWLSAVAGFAWLYAASSWGINHQGRKWFNFTASVVVGILALVVLWGNTTGARYPAAESSTVFSFFPNRNQTANFLALGGVAAFGYAMSSLRKDRLLPILGFIASSLCFLALVWGISRAGVLLFFTGIVLVYLLYLLTGRASKGIKLGFPLLIVAFSIFLVSNSKTTERIVDFVVSTGGLSDDYRVRLAKDTWSMIESAPLTGHGLGTFAVVFPQYRDLSANHQRVVHPESDVLWLAAESGFVGLALLLGFIVAYLARCRGLSRGPSGGYRLTAIAAVTIFMLHGLVDVSGHRAGTVYFAILFAALALTQEKKRPATFKPKVWRLCGGVLVFAGLLWGLSGVAGLPFHSSVAVARYESKIEQSIESGNYASGLQQADKWIDLRPLDWRAYFQRAALTLSESGALGEAAADFRRARFVEPNIGVVAFKEGFAWLPYDTNRVIAAWREVFFREVEKRESVFRSMLAEAKRKPDLMAGLARLSELDPYYRAYFLNYQSGDYFMQELAHDLENNPRLAQFSRQQRTSILKNWIRQGDRKAVETFLEKNGPSLNQAWWLWSLLRREQANFEDAVQIIRENTEPPALPELSIEGVATERLVREFSVMPGDLLKGTTLLQRYIDEGNFRKVREITETMMAAQRQVPPYVFYWHAESYFQLQDYIESWYAYEKYFERLWNEQ